MMNHRTAFLLFIIVAWLIAGWSASTSEAATYYIDAGGGEDANDGLSEATAWRSLGNIGKPFAEGDSILLKRGEIWREEAVVSSSGITIGAYGEGHWPIICGANLLTTWTDAPDPAPSKVWQTEIPLARTHRFAPKRMEVFFDVTTWGPLGKPSLDELKEEQQWHWSDQHKLLYVRSPADPKERYDSVEAAVRFYGIQGKNGAARVKVSGLEFRQQKYAGIRLMPGSEDWVVEDCHFHHMGHMADESGDGILCQASGSTFRRNTIYECGHSAINLDAGVGVLEDVVIEENELYDCYHNIVDVKTQPVGIVIDGVNIRYNRIYCTDQFTRSGVAGVFIRGNSGKLAQNVRIYYNLIYNTTGDSINTDEYVDHIYVYNNLFMGTRGSDTRFFSSHDVAGADFRAEVKNNIGVNAQGECLKIFDITNKTVDFNCWYQAPNKRQRVAIVAGKSYSAEEWEVYQAETGFDAHSLWGVNPLLVDPPNDSRQSLEYPPRPGRSEFAR